MSICIIRTMFDEINRFSQFSFLLSSKTKQKKAAVSFRNKIVVFRDKRRKQENVKKKMKHGGGDFAHFSLSVSLQPFNTLAGLDWCLPVWYTLRWLVTLLFQRWNITTWLNLHWNLNTVTNLDWSLPTSKSLYSAIHCGWTLKEVFDNHKTGRGRCSSRWKWKKRFESFRWQQMEESTEPLKSRKNFTQDNLCAQSIRSCTGSAKAMRQMSSRFGIFVFV